MIILGLQLRLWIGDGSVAEVSRLNDAIEEQATENAELEARNQELLTEVDELKSGTDAVEEMAREELGLIKEGETFYMIVEPDSSDQAGQPDAARQDAEP